jgi:hypothetical protein
VCGIESALNILRIGTGDLAESLSSDRCDVFEILAGSGLDPLATNVVAIAFAKAHLVAELSRMYCSQCRHREILLGVGHFQADARNPWGHRIAPADLRNLGSASLLKMRFRANVS